MSYIAYSHKTSIVLTDLSAKYFQVGVVLLAMCKVVVSFFGGISTSLTN